MGLFDFFKKDEENQKPKLNHEDSNVLLSMPIFTKGNRYQLENLVSGLRSDWGLTISQIDGNDDSAVLTIEGEMVAIAFMSFPIPADEIENTAYYAYNWPNALSEVQKVDGHAIVSVMSSNNSTLSRFLLQTKILMSILNHGNAFGIYQGSQTLLFPKDQYLAFESHIKEGNTPVPLWVYFGVQSTEEGNSMYTYGLKEFNKMEMEVLHASDSLENIHTFLLNICSYIINNDVSFQEGETLGYTQDQHVLISKSKGHFLDGETLKLAI
ncbi:DUF4261 domain-containing protein [Sphingobacterium kyonggiense]